MGVVDQSDDFDGVGFDDLVLVGADELFDESDDELLFESDDDLVDESEDVDPAGVVVEVLPRLSFLKNPLPLNVTPTGWNTFLTASMSPESGWATSVSVSSLNDC